MEIHAWKKNDSTLSSKDVTIQFLRFWSSTIFFGNNIAFKDRPSNITEFDFNSWFHDEKKYAPDLLHFFFGIKQAGKADNQEGP